MFSRGSPGVTPRNLEDGFVPLFDRAQDGLGCVWNGASEDRVVGDLVAADQREELVGQAGDDLGELIARPCGAGVGVDRVAISRAVTG
ncbi:MAG TPA: hypothetical protein VIK04_16380 [Solirubrobacteraceae bacterium]